MMKKIALIPFVLFLLSASLAVKEDQDALQLNLFYTKDYPGDNWENHKTGLLWTLSYLGAALPKDSFDKSISWIDSSRFTLRMNKLGFNKQAEESLKDLLEKIKAAKDYENRKALDLGAFVSLTIGSSYNYYNIVGVPKTLKEFYSLHHFNRYSVFPVQNSGVAKHQRLLKYKTSSPAITDWVFVAEDGESGAERPGVFEVYDIMANGQLRFAVYDARGDLLGGSPSSLSQAGKPAKCMWCHEINILPLFTKNDSVTGFITPWQFNNDVAYLMQELTAYRKTLRSDLDFLKTQDHTKMELLYISYMQPSVRRLSQEWQLGDKEAVKLVSKLKKRKHEEFSFLGELINRAELKSGALSLPASIRETSSTEPRYFK